MATKMDKAQSDRHQLFLANLLKDDDNKYCADCDAKGPRWASWNIGIFLCIRCAGIHRNLGVHISKVKSVNLDSWKLENLGMIYEMGNSRGRAVYEANLPDNFRRPQSDSALEQFIRAKYEHKRYIAREFVPPSPNYEALKQHIAQSTQAFSAVNTNGGGQASGGVGALRPPSATSQHHHSSSIGGNQAKPQSSNQGGVGGMQSSSSMPQLPQPPLSNNGVIPRRHPTGANNTATATLTAVQTTKEAAAPGPVPTNNLLDLDCDDPTPMAAGMTSAQGAVGSSSVSALEDIFASDSAVVNSSHQFGDFMNSGNSVTHHDATTAAAAAWPPIESTQLSSAEATSKTKTKEDILSLFKQSNAAQGNRGVGGVPTMPPPAYPGDTYTAAAAAAAMGGQQAFGYPMGGMYYPNHPVPVSAVAAATSMPSHQGIFMDPNNFTMQAPAAPHASGGGVNWAMQAQPSSHPAMHWGAGNGVPSVAAAGGFGPTPMGGNHAGAFGVQHNPFMNIPNAHGFAPTPQSAAAGVGGFGMSAPTAAQQQAVAASTQQAYLEQIQKKLSGMQVTSSSGGNAAASFGANFP